MKTLLLCMFAAGSVMGQNAVHVDISGEWRMSSDDQSRYADPRFDDSAWTRVNLPWTSRPVRGVYWLRRAVQLPATNDGARLAITLGSIAEAYELHVNGSLSGKFGGFSNEESQVARPRTFEISPDLSQKGRLVIAVRVWKNQGYGTFGWVRFRDGPYLLTNPGFFPADYGNLLLTHTQWQRSPDLEIAAIEFLFALILLACWSKERGRKELLWFGLWLAAESFFLATQVLLASPRSHPWSWWLRNVSVVAVRPVLFAEAVIATFRLNSWWRRAPIWIGAAIAVVVRAADPQSSSYGVINTVWLLAAWFVVEGWRSSGARKAAVRNSLAVLFACSLILNANRLGLQLGLSNTVSLGDFQLSAPDAVDCVLSLLIIALLLYELLADRREKERLATEIEAARAVQQLLLPLDDSAAGVFQTEAVYEPAQEVGGDFHWKRFDVDGSLLVAVGDVSGKGLKAAMLASLAIGVLRTERSNSPAAILSSLNAALAGRAGAGFVTCCCARFQRDGTTIVANAGHPAPYSGGREIELDAGLPLGIDPETRYTEATLHSLTPVTFVSDGVIEAAKPNGELLGFDRTREIAARSAAEIAEAARAWGQNDDITVVTVRRSA